MRYRKLVACLVLAAGLMGIYTVWFRDAPEKASEKPGSGTGPAESEIALADFTLPDVQADPEPLVRPGSMQATMLAGSDSNRRSIVGQTLRGLGLECPDLQGVDRVADDGTAWRANCGLALIYWIEVDDFGRISAQPAAYGDIELAPVLPNAPQRTLEFRQAPQQ